MAVVVLQVHRRARAARSRSIACGSAHHHAHAEPQGEAFQSCRIPCGGRHAHAEPQDAAAQSNTSCIVCDDGDACSSEWLCEPTETKTYTRWRTMRDTDLSAQQCTCHRERLTL